uniref:Secreted protein n=1 Tax=Mesocestoides corti TaxID=53468 RepID=A0A5K3FBS5_MESCO
MLCPLYTASYSCLSLVGCVSFLQAVGTQRQRKTKATRQAPSIRVHHAGHAAHYILHLSHVLLWLAAYLPRMPFERREIHNWLRPGGPICLSPNTSPHYIPLKSEAVLSFCLGSPHCC